MTDSDRDMLMWAAKAAGMQIDQGVKVGSGHLLVMHEGTPSFWNPFDDNGQAFELLVLLQLPFSFIILLPNEKSNTVACGSRWDEKECLFYAFEESLSRDPLAAARRAIVRAAAEIGRNMK